MSEMVVQLWGKCERCPTMFLFDGDKLLEGSREDGVKEMQRQCAAAGWLMLEDACYCPEHRDQKELD